MTSLIYNPAPFLNEELVFISLKLIASIIVLTLGYMAYRFCRERKYLIFGFGFTLIAAGFMFKLLSYFFFIKNNVCYGCMGYTWFVAFYYVFVLAYIVGASTLALLYVKVHDRFALVFMGILLLLTSFIALGSFSTFSGFLALIFGFVALRALTRYLQQKSKSTLITFFAFASISLAQFLRALGDMLYSYNLLLAGEIFSLVGFLLLAYVLVRVYSK